MDGTGVAGLAGVVAGLGVAMPLGAIGVLLLRLAISAGRREAAAGALGVALVDLTYAAMAILAGTAATRWLAGYERAVQIGGAFVLLAVVGRGLLGVRQDFRAVRPGPEPGPGPGSGSGSGSGSEPVVALKAASPSRALVRFVGLTAVNPLTAVYFVALSAGSGPLLHGPQRTAAFLVGVFVASLSWQLLLVGVGATAGRRLGHRARLGTGLLGYLVVLGYAVRLAMGAG